MNLPNCSIGFPDDKPIPLEILELHNEPCYKTILCRQLGTPPWKNYARIFIPRELVAEYIFGGLDE